MVGPIICILLSIDNQTPLLLCLEKMQTLLQRQTGNTVVSQGNRGYLKV